MVATDSAMRSTWRSSSARVHQVLAEGLLVPDRLGRTVGRDRAGVLAPGQRGQMEPAGLAQPAHQCLGRNGGQLAHGAHAELVQAGGRGRTDAPQRLHLVAVQERQLGRRAR